MCLIRNAEKKFAGAGEANYRHRLKAPLFTVPQGMLAQLIYIYRDVFIV